MNYDRQTGPPTACCAYQFSKQESYYGQTHKKDDVHINAFLYKRSGLNIYLYTGNKFVCYYIQKLTLTCPAICKGT